MAIAYRQTYNPLSGNFERVPVAGTESGDFVVVESDGAISDDVLSDNVPMYSDNEATTQSGTSMTFGEKDFLVNFTPTGNFTINKGTLVDGTTYILRVTPDSAYTITLGSGVTNPFNEDLTLTANKTTMIVLFAVDNGLELQSVRTFA